MTSRGGGIGAFSAFSVFRCSRSDRDRLRLARYGIPAEDVLEVVEASRVGKNAGRIFEGPRRFDLMLLLPPSSSTPEALGELPIGTPDGRLIPMVSVASIRETEGPAVINREALERRVLVEANVRGRDLVSFVGDAQRAVAEVGTRTSFDTHFPRRKQP